MRISDWSSDVCSSDLTPPPAHQERSPAMNTAVSHETERLHPAADTILRLLRVALQIASTLALARILAIGDTGLFFHGLVVTIAGATFMRAKFVRYISRHILGRLQRQPGLSTDEESGRAHV